jgi:hypothetical protein
MCPHPVATVAWPYAEVRDHWDELQIYSEVTVNGHTLALQDNRLSSLVDLEYLLALDVVRGLENPMFLYCGASPFLSSVVDKVRELDLPDSVAHGGGDEFRARLHDPVLNRTIQHRYRALPVGDDLAERMDRSDI